MPPPVFQMMGTCKLPMALSCASGFATETSSGVDNLVNCIVGWALQIASACAWLTKDKLQQESKGKGSGISAEVIRVHRKFLLARSMSEMCKLLGTAVIAGLPNAGAWDKISCVLWGFETDADWGRASSLSMRVVNDCMSECNSDFMSVNICLISPATLRAVPVALADEGAGGATTWTWDCLSPWLSFGTAGTTCKIWFNCLHPHCWQVKHLCWRRLRHKLFGNPQVDVIFLLKWKQIWLAGSPPPCDLPLFIPLLWPVDWLRCWPVLYLLLCLKLPP